MKDLLKYISVTALAVLCLGSCKQANLKRVRVAPEGVSVKVQTAAAAEVVSQKNYVGSLEVSREATVNAPHSGVLEKVLVKEGDKLRQGQVIAVINAQTVRSSYDAAMAALAQAEDGYDRALKVYQSGSMTEVKMVEVRTQLAQARASADAARSALAECSVKAPFAGTVSDINILCGERVSLAQPLVTLADVSDLEVAFPVPENEVHAVNPGDSATVYFPALDRYFNASVKTKAVVGNVLSHSYKCTLALRSKESGMLPGMVCRVYLSKDEARGIIIPANIVKMDTEGRYVWTVDDSDTVRKTRISTGGFSGKGVVVTDGIEEGDRIIVEGFSKVSGGMKVKVK